MKTLVRNPETGKIVALTAIAGVAGFVIYSIWRKKGALPPGASVIYEEKHSLGSFALKLASTVAIYEENKINSRIGRKSPFDKQM